MLFFCLVCSKLSYTHFVSLNSFMLVYNLIVCFIQVCMYLLTPKGRTGPTGAKPVLGSVV
jgi:hypothetical protein